MTNLSDISGWLASVAKVAWWILAALVAFSAVLLGLNAGDPSWFSPVPPHLVWIVWVVLLLSANLLIFRSIDRALGACNRHRQRRVRRKFSQLSDDQKRLLLQRYELGYRRFAEGGPQRQWLEELQEWNYVELKAVTITGGPTMYAITRAGWRELQRFQEKSRRRTEQ